MGSAVEALATLQYGVLPHERRIVILDAGLNGTTTGLKIGRGSDYSGGRAVWQYSDLLAERILRSSHLARRSWPSSSSGTSS